MVNLAVPAPSTLAPGNLVTGALWNAQVRDSLNFLLNPPLFRGIQTATQSIPNSAWTAVTLDSNIVDSYAGHSTTVNPSRYVSQATGWYEVKGVGTFAVNTTGNRALRFHVNGNPVNGSAIFNPTIATNSWADEIVDEVFLNVNDYVELAIFQTSGGALNTSCTGLDVTPRMNVRWIHQ